ncbi:MAG: hypothetical protein AAB330_01860 [Bacteroidota bacterium]
MTQQASGFEFSDVQNDVISRLSSRMKFVGIFYIVVGAMMGLGTVAMLFIMPPVAVIYGLATAAEILIGLWTNNAASSFRMITSTQGNDVGYLMNAIESLRKLYNLQFWLLIGGIALCVLVVIAVLVGGLAFMSQMAPTT